MHATPAPSSYAGPVTRILLTGFEPFAGAPSNPSWDAVRIVGETWSGAAETVTARLPVEFGGAADALASLVGRHTPDAVVAVGVAEGRAAITPERIAINLADATIADNAGARPVDEPIDVEGPAAAFSTLPVRAMVEAVTAAGLPASLSLSAGAYVCNHVMYEALVRIARDVPAVGFIHVPASPEMLLAPSVPTWPVQRTAAGLTLCLAAVVDHLHAPLPTT